MSATRTTSARIALVVMLGLLMGVVVTTLLSTSAVAQRDPYGGGTPTVLPTLIVRDGQPGEGKPDEGEPEVLPSRVERAEDAALPFTGADLTLFVGTAAAAIATGTVMVRRSRRGRDK